MSLFYLVRDRLCSGVVLLRVFIEAPPNVESKRRDLAAPPFSEAVHFFRL